MSRKLLTTIIAFACSMLFVHAQNAIPNPGFENWTNAGSYEDPDDWGTINSLTSILGIKTVTKATGADVHSGSYAMQMESKTVPFQGTAPGIAATGTINPSTQNVDGGVAFNKRPIALTGWYKYQPNGVDTGSVEVNFFKWNSTTQQRDKVGDAVFEQNVTVNTYTQFSVTINYVLPDAPDTMVIIILTSQGGSGSQSGTKLFIDDLAFDYCSNFSASVTTTDVPCFGDSTGSATAVNTNGTAPFTYAWDNGLGAVASHNNLPAGNYCVTITDDNGCTANACDTVNQPSAVSVSVTTHDATTTGGSDGSAKANVTGGTPAYTYLWDDVNNSTTDSIFNLPKHIYRVTVTDFNGCTSSASGSVSDPGCSTLDVTLTATDATTVGGADGTVMATPSGGTAPYTYLWDDSTASTNDTIMDLTAGHYCVTVTDDSSCQTVECADVSGPDCSGFHVNVTGTNPTTVGGTDGTATANLTGGAANPSYHWSPGNQTTAAITGLAANTYCVTVTDGVGCAAQGCKTLSDPSCTGFSVTVAATDETVAGATDGTATATPTGGTGTVTYVWDDGHSGANITGLPPDRYCVIATNGNGCTATACDSVRAGAVGLITLEQAGIQLFPNPAREAVTVELENAADFSFRLFDVRGKLVLERMLNTKSTVISLADFPSGNYLYELKNSANGSAFTGKLLKE